MYFNYFELLFWPNGCYFRHDVSAKYSLVIFRCPTIWLIRDICWLLFYFVTVKAVIAYSLQTSASLWFRMIVTHLTNSYMHYTAVPKDTIGYFLEHLYSESDGYRSRFIRISDNFIFHSWDDELSIDFELLYTSLLL